MGLVKGDATVVVKALKARAGKNTYTQGPNRNRVGEGWGDCSATMQWCYKKIGVTIGGFTGDQIKNGVTVDRGVVLGHKPNVANLLPGDLIFYKGKAAASSFRPYGVGHVEMYIGDGKVMGHGSGKGPTVKDFMKYRQHEYIMAKRLVSPAAVVAATKPAVVDQELAVTKDMLATIDSLAANKIINKPELWKSKLLNEINVGEAFALMRAVHFTLVPTAEVNDQKDYRLNSIQYLSENGLINEPGRWTQNIDQSIQAWVAFAVLGNIMKNMDPSLTDPNIPAYKIRAVAFANKNGLTRDIDIWAKKIDEPMLVWELAEFIKRLYLKMK